MTSYDIVRYSISFLQNEKVIGDEPRKQDPLLPADLSLKAHRRPSPRHAGEAPAIAKASTSNSADLLETRSAFLPRLGPTRQKTSQEGGPAPRRSKKARLGPGTCPGGLVTASFAVYLTCAKSAGDSHTRPRSPNYE